MPSEYGEIRYDAPDMLIDVRRVAHTLNSEGRVFFRYAAFGTLHCFLGFDSRLLLANNGVDRVWAGPDFCGPPGVGDPGENGHTLWIRQNDNKGQSAWLNRGGYHDPTYLVEKFLDHPNPVDALGLGVLFLLIETRRGLIYDIVPTIEHWIDVLEGEREMPAFIEAEATGANATQGENP